MHWTEEERKGRGWTQEMGGEGGRRRGRTELLARPTVNLEIEWHFIYFCASVVLSGKERLTAQINLT